MNKNKWSFRIHTKDNRIKYAGTGKDSWFFNLDIARKKVDYSKGETIYTYINCNKIGEVF